MPLLTPCANRSAVSNQRGPASTKSPIDSAPNASRDPMSSGRRPIRSASRPAGTCTSVLVSSGPATNMAMSTEPPPWAATYSGAMGKMAAIPVNITTWPESSQKTELRPLRLLGGAATAPVIPGIVAAVRRPGLPFSPVDYDGTVAAEFTPVDDDLYREIILDHYRNPRHHARVEPADREVAANNPICGDQIDLSLRLRDGTVDAIGFTGRGCSISQASASMLCETVSGRTEA